MSCSNEKKNTTPQFNEYKNLKVLIKKMPDSYVKKFSQNEPSKHLLNRELRLLNLKVIVKRLSDDYVMKISQNKKTTDKRDDELRNLKVLSEKLPYSYVKKFSENEPNQKSKHLLNRELRLLNLKVIVTRLSDDYVMKISQNKKTTDKRDDELPKNSSITNSKEIPEDEYENIVTSNISGTERKVKKRKLIVDEVKKISENVERRISLEPKKLSELDALKNIIFEKLIETGEIDRLRMHIRQKLIAIGWKHDMMKEMKAIIHEKGSNITVQNLFDEISVRGREIDPVTRNELLTTVKNVSRKVLNENEDSETITEVRRGRERGRGQ